MHNKMPCHITDGASSPDDLFHVEHEDEDEAFESERQRRIDLGLCRQCGANLVPDSDQLCQECMISAAEEKESR